MSVIFIDGPNIGYPHLQDAEKLFNLLLEKFPSNTTRIGLIMAARHLDHSETQEILQNLRKRYPLFVVRCRGGLEDTYLIHLCLIAKSIGWAAKIVSNDKFRGKHLLRSSSCDTCDVAELI